MSGRYRVACLPCNEAPTIDQCSCADKGKVCPHPLYHPDFASASCRDRRVASGILQGLFGRCRKARQVRDFATHTGEREEDWMLWHGWSDGVGCNRCAENGRDAPCWGRAACHGYSAGCGCDQCFAEGLEVTG